ncbi:MAG: hypothetical protein QXR62_05560 [Candidatus Bathyarchaeia archaeon]|nr:hypothetical protein [Candidatus Bathyarchaeota archaeon]
MRGYSSDFYYCGLRGRLEARAMRIMRIAYRAAARRIFSWFIAFALKYWLIDWCLIGFMGLITSLRGCPLFVFASLLWASLQRT